jgi:serine/threonine protein kinase
VGANTHFVWLKNLAIRLSSVLCSRPRSCLAFNLFFPKIDGTSTTQLHTGVCANSRTRAVVKSADVENQTQVDCLVKEYKYYKKPSIESSRNFRKLCDIINDPIGWTAQKPFCLAFEWMDTTLAEVPFEEHMKDPVLVANIVKVCLEAFVELEKEHLVYSGMQFTPREFYRHSLSRADLKPANVLISSVDGLSKVKIGDLGLGTEHTSQNWVTLIFCSGTRGRQSTLGSARSISCS